MIVIPVLVSATIQMVDRMFGIVREILTLEHRNLEKPDIGKKRFSAYSFLNL